MKVAVLADPHSNLPALESILEVVSSRNPSEIFLAGDLVGYGPHPNEVIEHVAEEGMIAILGNHDQASLDRDFRGMNPYAAKAAEWTSSTLTESGRKYLEKLPVERIFEIEGRRMGLFHGSPADPLEYVYDPGRAKHLLRSSYLDIIIVGHTHIPMVVREGDRLFLNPGGVGQPRDGNPAASFAEIDLGSLEVQFFRIEYDISAAQKAMRESELPRYLADRLADGL